MLICASNVNAPRKIELGKHQKCKKSGLICEQHIRKTAIKPCIANFFPQPLQCQRSKEPVIKLSSTNHLKLLDDQLFSVLNKQTTNHE